MPKLVALGLGVPSLGSPREYKGHIRRKLRGTTLGVRVFIPWLTPLNMKPETPLVPLNINPYILKVLVGLVGGRFRHRTPQKGLRFMKLRGSHDLEMCAAQLPWYPKLYSLDPEPETQNPLHSIDFNPITPTKKIETPAPPKTDNTYRRTQTDMVSQKPRANAACSKLMSQACSESPQKVEGPVSSAGAS